MFATTAVAVFPLLMIVAAVSDLVTMRISNRLVLAEVIGFAAVALIAGLPMPELAMHVASGSVVLCAGFALFALGWIGGGDAKFAAATALWLGFGELAPFLVYAALLGGGLTLALLLARRWPLPGALAGVNWIGRLHDSKTGVPYGIALAAAGLLVYADTAVAQRLLG